MFIQKMRAYNVDEVDTLPTKKEPYYCIMFVSFSLALSLLTNLSLSLSVARRDANHKPTVKTAELLGKRLY